MPYEMTLNDGSKILVSDDIPKDEAEKAVNTAINLFPQTPKQDKLTLFRDVLSRVTNAITAPTPPPPPRLSSPFSAIASGKYINDMMNDLRLMYQAELERYKAMMQERAQLRMEELERKKMEFERIEKERMFLLNVLQNALNYKNMRDTLLMEQQKHRDMMTYRYDQLQNELARLREEISARKEIEKMRNDVTLFINHMDNQLRARMAEYSRIHNEQLLELRRQQFEETKRRNQVAEIIDMFKLLQSIGVPQDRAYSMLNNLYGNNPNQPALDSLLRTDKNINQFLLEQQQKQQDKPKVDTVFIPKENQEQNK